MTKVDIISGFLGAGKTTLIKKLLSEAFRGDKLVLIENEFGEVSVDGGFLRESGVQVSELSSGCICCTLVGDFTESLKQVYTQYQPDRILIEPSGVAKLSDVVAAIEDAVKAVPELKLNSFVDVVDATKVKVYLKNIPEYANQVESAGTIVLSRTQKLSQEKLEGAVTLLREKNATAAIITTPWDELEGKTILQAIEGVSMHAELLELVKEAHEHQHEHELEDEEEKHEHHHHHDHDHGEECSCGCHDHDHGHHHADEVFTSWGRETVKPFAKEELERILTELDLGECGAILRAKGIVPAGDGSWLHFDYVPEEHQVRTGPADYTGRLCVIGAELKEDRLAALFGL